MATREWRDGLLSRIMRELGQEVVLPRACVAIVGAAVMCDECMFSCIAAQRRLQVDHSGRRFGARRCCARALSWLGLTVIGRIPTGLSQ